MSHQEASTYQPFPSFTEWWTGEFDHAGLDMYERLLDDAKRRASPASLEKANTAAARYAAVDTNAIEGIYSVDRGFTRTVATQAAAWEAAMDRRGEHARNAFEDALSAYDYVLDAATKRTEVSQLWIKEIHQIICKSQQTYTVRTSVGNQEQELPKGSYKTMPSSPTKLDGSVHAYATPADTGPEMSRLVEELRSEAFMAAHPIVQAAFAHYAYVAIHPFADGNGRVARALASVYLYRSPGVPLVVFADQRNEYFDALERADLGDSAPFIQFIAVRTVDAIGIVRSMLQASSAPVAQSLRSIHELFDSGVEDEELIAGAALIQNLAVANAREQLSGMLFPGQLEVSANGGQIKPIQKIPKGYAATGKDASFYIAAQSTWPHRVFSITQLEVCVSTSNDQSSEFMLTSGDESGLEIWIREVTPTVTETLRLKLAGWLEGKISELLEDVVNQANATNPVPTEDV